MSHVADRILPGSAPRSVARTMATLLGVSAFLVLQSGLGSVALSAAGIVLGGALLVHERHALQPVLVLTCLVGFLSASAALAAAATDWPVGEFAVAASRIGCGCVWLAWLGTQLDWVSLRAGFEALRVPVVIVTTMDQSIAQALLTVREWRCRRDAARLRLGSAALPVSAWSNVIGEGVLAAIERAERIAESQAMRSARSSTTEFDVAVDVQRLVVARGGRRLLDGIDLRIGAGESIALCGPSGAGKTTLLQALAGLRAPLLGQLHRFDALLDSRTPGTRRLDGRVALLCQNPEHHFLASTVGDDVAWGLVQRGVAPAEARARVRDALCRLGLDETIERGCHTLSFGEQRRVALAGLLLTEPQLLLLDEPTAGLDPVAAARMTGWIEEQTRGRRLGIVWATHDWANLPGGIARVVLMRDGRIVFDGPRAEALGRPALLSAGLTLPTGEEEDAVRRA